MDDHDSTADSLEHSVRVGRILAAVIGELAERATHHDASKLLPPEKAIFDQFASKLASVAYGSEEYHEILARMRPALDHHYAHNSHHPEHRPDGVAGMTLVDLIEMLADWGAASGRRPGADFARSLDINRERFAIGAQLDAILRNTARHWGLLP